MNRRSLLIPVALLAAATWAAAGCGGVKRPFQGRLDPHPPGQLHFASQMLQDNTAVGTPSVSRDEVGNILHVTVPIRSTRNEPMYVDYRVTFFDRNHQQLIQTGWFTRTLTPNVPDFISVKSMTPAAADFAVDFREAK